MPFLRGFLQGLIIPVTASPPTPKPGPTLPLHFSPIIGVSQVEAPIFTNQDKATSACKTVHMLIVFKYAGRLAMVSFMVFNFPNHHHLKGRRWHHEEAGKDVSFQTVTSKKLFQVWILH